jgi:uncharacterized membrane protein
MGSYEVLLFLHVVGAIVWVGVGLTGHALEAWFHRHGEWTLLARLQPAWASIEPLAAVGGPLLLLGTGVALVADGPWGFGDTWIVIGLSGYAAALALGVVFQAPGVRRLTAIAGERGPDDPEAIAVARRLHALMGLELAVLAVVLLAMTTKPTRGGSVGFWVVSAVILTAALGLAARGVRGHRVPRDQPHAPADIGASDRPDGRLVSRRRSAPSTAGPRPKSRTEPATRTSAKLVKHGVSLASVVAAIVAPQRPEHEQRRIDNPAAEAGR